MASGIACRLHRVGAKIVMLETEEPLAVRRTVSFCEAVRLGEQTVEGVLAKKVNSAKEALELAKTGSVAVLVDPWATSLGELHPDVLVDAILAKRNIGTTKDMAPVVIGVGPGFTAGPYQSADCHAAIETKRGHYLGRVIYDGSPIPNTGVPGNIGGYSVERVLRAPADGIFEPIAHIGDVVEAGQLVAMVSGQPLLATIDGVLRGLLQEGVHVTKGLKSGDIDPRAKPGYVHTVSDKSRAIAGGVLEAAFALSHVLPAFEEN